MELKDFIERTLVDIVRGVRGAQSDSEAGAFIVPAGAVDVRAFPQNLGVSNFQNGWLTTVVQFDIAVAAETHQARSGKAGISVKIVEGGTQGERGSKNVEANRIRFSVPLRLPEARLVPTG